MIALIGSFRKHYESHVLPARQIFLDAGWIVTSPLGDPIDREGLFVRFTSDATGDEAGDHIIQTKTLHRIFRANATYVISPDGYVGRTTSYEIGRITQAQKPLYFSDHPKDLPLLVPDRAVLSPRALVEQVSKGTAFRALFDQRDDEYALMEHRLLKGDYSDA